MNMTWLAQSFIDQYETDVTRAVNRTIQLIYYMSEASKATHVLAKTDFIVQNCSGDLVVLADELHACLNVLLPYSKNYNVHRIYEAKQILVTLQLLDELAKKHFEDITIKEKKQFGELYELLKDSLKIYLY